MTKRKPLATDALVFEGSHAPTLGPGSYELTVKQTLVARKGNEITGETTQAFRVAGPQLALAEGDVLDTYPANLASGKFFNVLPHVTLKRSTLPWERRAIPGTDAAPWLVLAVLDEDELASATQSTAGVADTPKARGIASLHPEIAHDQSDPDLRVNLLSLTAAQIDATFPPPDDLHFLTHVRRVVPAPPGKAEQGTATVIACRLPTPNKRNHVFLLNAEHRYTAATTPAAGAFAILHQWSFFCEDITEHGFVELIEKAVGPNKTPPPLGLGPQPGLAPESQAWIDAGAVPVRHQMRRGDQSAAWYHGPLVPSPPKAAPALHLPADHADQLALLDADNAVFDVSYGAAWELGRLIVLEHTDIATELYHWKRAISHADHLGGALPAMPGHLHDWLMMRLVGMRDIPFVNLIPDEALLPADSLRFFDVDPFWLDCLRDGALSVGRTDSRARKLDLHMRATLPDLPVMSGILMRSAVVRDFPTLEVDGYAQVPATPDKPDYQSAHRLDHLRFDRLSDSVLMVVFEGRVAVADLHLHPQAMHFGIQRDDGTRQNGAEYIKTTRHRTPAKSVDLAHNAKAPMVNIRPSGRIDMTGLAAALGLTKVAHPVAEFALDMLEGVPLVRVSRTI